MLLLRNKPSHCLRHLYLLSSRSLSTDPDSGPEPELSGSVPDAQYTRTAFGFHPNVSTIDAPFQSLVLTKTLHFNELPPSLTQGSSPLCSTLEPLFREAILLSVGKDKRVLTRRYKEKPEKELNTSDFYFSLIMNLVRLALIPQGALQPVLTYRPYVAFEWRTFDAFFERLEWIRVRGRPFGWLISSSENKVPPLFVTDQEEIDQLSRSPLHDLFPVSPFIGLTQHPQRPSCYAGTHPAQPEFRAPHTLIYLHNRKQTYAQNYQSVVMHLFSLLASYATLHCGAALGHELASPLSAQAVLTNGDKFTFFYYQLNTLQFEQLDKGSKNLLYTSDREIPLYRFDLMQERVTELNGECLRLFVQTLNNFVDNSDS